MLPTIRAIIIPVATQGRIFKICFQTACMTVIKNSHYISCNKHWQYYTGRFFCTENESHNRNYGKSETAQSGLSHTKKHSQQQKYSEVAWSKRGCIERRKEFIIIYGIGWQIYENEFKPSRIRRRQYRLKRNSSLNYQQPCLFAKKILL